MLSIDEVERTDGESSHLVERSPLDDADAVSGNVFSTRHEGTIQIRLWDDGEL